MNAPASGWRHREGKIADFGRPDDESWEITMHEERTFVLTNWANKW